MTDNFSRQPRGIPVGGQFAATSHTEPDLVLGKPERDVHFDPDGTEWEWADPGAEVLSTGLIGKIGIEINTRPGHADKYTFRVVDFSNLRTISTGEGTDLDEVKAVAKELRANAARYGSNNLRVGSRTPWGTADGVTHVAPGIDNVFTPGHGGVKLSRERNKEVDPIWRQKAGWYEEDCEWAIAAITHREAYSEEHQKYAHQSARRWFPDEYEQVVGKDPARYGVADYKPIAPGESNVRDEKVFFAANYDKVQRAFSASYSKDHEGMTEVLVSDVTPTGARTGTARTVLMPNDEYSALGNFRTIRKDAPYQTLKEN
jgi:hypothetical protein